jgi:hypothetical protein
MTVIDAIWNDDFNFVLQNINENNINVKVGDVYPSEVAFLKSYPNYQIVSHFILTSQTGLMPNCSDLLDKLESRLKSTKYSNPFAFDLNLGSLLEKYVLNARGLTGLKVTPVSKAL